MHSGRIYRGVEREVLQLESREGRRLFSKGLYPSNPSITLIGLQTTLLYLHGTVHPLQLI